MGTPSREVSPTRRRVTSDKAGCALRDARRGRRLRIASMNTRVAIFLALILGFSLSSLSARSYREAPELEKLFAEKGVQGTFALLDSETDTIIVSNEARAKQRFTPASTFKIANSLIGLETGAVKNVDEVLPYGGKPQRFKHWERDM